jgi:nucleoside-diphosphate-sugar epimerase
MSKILLIGGEGYIGSELKSFFLQKGNFVVSLDNLIFKQKKPKNTSNFKFYKLDISNYQNYKNIIYKYNFDLIVLLAGLVGDPITKKYPKESKAINLNGVKKTILTSLKHSKAKFVFISTCSNYGIKKKPATEKSKLKPLSSYAEHKVFAEKFIMSKKFKKDCWTILRFATIYGPSKRMRFDLTINEFVRELYYKKKLLVYDPNTVRPYCYIDDVARLLSVILKSDKKIISNKIFNVGRNDQNFSKRELVIYLKKFFKKGDIEFLKKTVDKRNYRVKFDKIKKQLGFEPKTKINLGIKNIINSIKLNKKNYINKKKYGNYSI